MSMNPSTVQPATSLPANERDVWDLAYIPLVDWTAGVEIASSYNTRVSGTLSVAEQRRQLKDRPRRSQRVFLKTMTREDTYKASTLLMRMAQQPFLMPVYPDRFRLQADITTSDNAITLPNADGYSRFYSGQRVLIASIDSARRYTSWERAVIDTVVGDTITMTANFGANYSAGSVIFPLMECQLAFNSSMSMVTDSHAEGQITGIERVGNMGILPYTTPGSNPPSFDVTSDGLPILDLQQAWNLENDFGVLREGGYSGSGNAEVATTYGTYPLWTWRVSIRSLNRENAFKLIEFFDSRAGRCYPFVMLHPMHEIADVQSIGASDIVARLNYPYDHFDYRPRIYVKLYDGTVQVRNVSSVVAGAQDTTINVDTPWSPTFTASEIKRASFATTARFDSDELIQQWRTDGMMDSGITVRQLINEQDITVSNITIPTTTSLPATFDPAQCPPVGCDDGNPASFCSAGGTPAQVTLDFTDVFLCGCDNGASTVSCPGESFEVKWSGADPLNGQHILSQDGTNAKWTKTISNVVVDELFLGNTTCTGTGSTSGPYDLIITAEKIDATTLDISVEAILSGVFYAVLFFAARVSVTSGFCEFSISAIGNDFTSGNCYQDAANETSIVSLGTYDSVAHSGTVDIECGPPV